MSLEAVYQSIYMVPLHSKLDQKNYWIALL